MGAEYWTGFYQGAAFFFVVEVALSIWWLALRERSRAKAQRAKDEAARIESLTMAKIDSLTRRVESLETRLDPRREPDAHARTG